MGCQHNGLYSYDWLDLLFGVLDRPRSDLVLPEFQQLAVGDKISLWPRQQLIVKAIVPSGALVLYSNEYDVEWVWQFDRYSADANRTRLISRGTERIPRGGGRFGMLIMKPARFIMTRRVPLGVIPRAEALRSSRYVT